MKDKEFVVEKIRSQYTEQEHTELDALKALDATAKKLPLCSVTPAAALVLLSWAPA